MRMELLIVLLQDYIVFIVGGLFIGWVFLLILLLGNHKKLKKLQNKYELFMSNSEGQQIEDLLTNYLNRVEQTLEGQEQLHQKYAKLEHQLGYCVQKIGVIRYNPFDEMGGNLCFAVALLDERDNGVVLNGILNREGSYTYAKHIEQGKSTYALSAEEVQALDMAKRQGYRS